MLLVGQAIEMYVKQRKHLSWAIKISMVLAIIILLVLGANMGLGFVVVRLTQVRRRPCDCLERRWVSASFSFLCDQNPKPTPRLHKNPKTLIVSTWPG
jgi:hypothetical protein